MIVTAEAGDKGNTHAMCSRHSLQTFQCSMPDCFRKINRSEGRLQIRIAVNS